jgi:DNA-binding PadR family transcriptional regulator
MELEFNPITHELCAATLPLNYCVALDLVRGRYLSDRQIKEARSSNNKPSRIPTHIGDLITAFYGSDGPHMWAVAADGLEKVLSDLSVNGLIAKQRGTGPYELTENGQHAHSEMRVYLAKLFMHTGTPKTVLAMHMRHTSDITRELAAGRVPAGMRRIGHGRTHK